MLVVSVIASPVSAAHVAGHIKPQGPAKLNFASDFPLLTDHEWGFRMAGFGGTGNGQPLKHVPVVFVHGNNVDACDWYPVRDEFKKAGWSDQEIYALSYNGLGGNNGAGLLTTNDACRAEHTAMGYDGTTRVTGNDVNVPDLYDFILAVRSYTGSKKFSLASHSLGVTLARKVLKVHPELRADLVAFVGIAGANHGTTFCPPGSETTAMSCNEIAAGTPWLSELNGTGGNDETYGPARWMTVYDGSGAGDPAFVGPTYAQSPALKGADNRQFAGTYHNDLRMSTAIIAVYRAFLESAEQSFLLDLPGASGGSGVRSGNLAATGSATAIQSLGLIFVMFSILMATAAIYPLR
jgi:pimeloyl-ACP methyl ester carboxylesterase